MIEKIRIENFKNFEEFEFDGFRRVNLIAGKNNVGKTNLLEALYMGYTGFFPMGLIDLYSYRAQVPVGKISKSREPETFSDGGIFQNAALGSFFNGSNRISLKTNDTTETTLEKCNFEVTTKYDGAKPNFDLILLEPKEYDSNLPNNALVSYFTGNGNRLQRFAVFINFPFNPFSISPAKARFGFLHAGSFGISGFEKQYQEVFHTGRMKKFRDILSMFSDTEIEDTQLIDNKTDGFKILYLSTANRGIVPAGDLGFGTNRMVSILLTLFGAENGVAFLDEVDLGIHYSRQNLLWERIFQVAKELNVQIFATTHSRDCIEAFANIFNKNKGEGKYIRLQEREGKIVAKAYDEEALNRSVEFDSEMR